MNKPLATMYYLKEELTTMWCLGGKANSEAYLQNWVARAINSGIKQLVKVGNMIGTYRTAILRWFDFDLFLKLKDFYFAKIVICKCAILKKSFDTLQGLFYPHFIVL